jgi:DNA-binding LacI/PurR family transcriptional regulator
VTPLSLKSRLAERVREAIRAEVLQGRWKDELPSERHLSIECEVSRPTLHTALRSLEQEGLLRFRRGLPWLVLRSHRSPRRLPPRRPEVVMIRNAQLKPDITSLLPFIDLLRHDLHRLGLDLVVVDAMVQRARHLDKTLSEIEAEHRASFYVLLSVPDAVHRWYEHRGLRAVILGLRASDVTLPAIEFDSRAVIQHAVEYLVRRGHRRIGLLMSVLASVGDIASVERFTRICASRASEGVEGICEVCVTRAPAVKNAVRKLLTRPSPPTAVIATDLEHVLGLHAIAADLGLRIPKRLSVVSTNHSPIFEYLSPVPTSYQLSWKKMAKRTTMILRDYQRLGVWPNRFHNLLPTLREGQSVRTLS